MTRDELIGRLIAVGVDVDEGDLRFWEYHGVLPRAVKKWHDGANRVFYPRWMIATVARLRALQDNGVPLRDIGHRLRADAAKDIAGLTFLAESDPVGSNASGIKGDNLLRWIGGRARYDILQPSLMILVEHFEAITGESVSTIEVRFLKKDGKAIDSYSLGTGPDLVLPRDRS